MQVELIEHHHGGRGKSFSFLPEGATQGTHFQLRDGNYDCFKIEGKAITSLGEGGFSQIRVASKKLKTNEPHLLTERDSIEIVQGQSRITLKVLHLPGTDSEIDINDLLLSLPEVDGEPRSNGTTVGHRTNGRLIKDEPFKPTKG